MRRLRPPYRPRHAGVAAPPSVRSVAAAAAPTTATFRRTAGSYVLYRHQRFASAAAAVTAASSSSSSTSSSLVDWSQAVGLDHDSVRLVPEAITPEEEQQLVQELEKPLRRRRLMANHWDSVIEHYREVEKRTWEEPGNAAVVRRIRARVLELLGLAPDLPCLPVHVIDLAAEGFIKPHVDSVKFSGGFVAGLSLLSPAIMRLQGEKGRAPTSSVVRMLLKPRSLYLLSGAARYDYAHEILPSQEEGVWVDGKPVQRDRRISLIFRDELGLPSSPAR